jgi:hypothetical protein
MAVFRREVSPSIGAGVRSPYSNGIKSLKGVTVAPMGVIFRSVLTKEHNSADWRSTPRYARVTQCTPNCDINRLHTPQSQIGTAFGIEMERNIDRNGSSKPRVARNVRTFGDLIDLHDEDMHEVGRPPRRSKAAVMASLKTALGSVKLPALNRERLIEFGRKRAKEGAGPATLAIDLSFIRTIITHAAAVHGIEVSAEEARLARVALSHLNLVGKSNERDRRPTQDELDELDELIEYFETNRRQFIPMGRIVRYAVATTLRQEEICKPEWPLVDMKKRLVVPMGRPQVVEMLVHGYRTTERFFPRCGRNGFTNLAAAVVTQPKQAKPWNELPGFLGELGARAIRTNSNHQALSKRPTTKVAVTTSSMTTFSLLICTCLVKCSFTR